MPDLATSWSWSEDGTELTFPLRQGVKWHDGKPFTAADVQCTWDLLLEKSSDKLRVNPRKSWYKNLERVTTNGDYEVTFHLKRPQPAFPMRCSLPAGRRSIPAMCRRPQMRQHPIGTGPFKFVEFKPNESIKVARNPDYWKPGRPYLDGIEYTIIGNRSTAILAFVAGKFDMTSPYAVAIPLLKDVSSQTPQAICEVTPTNVNRNLIINRDKPPFDNPDLRRAMALSLDRKAFIDILSEGQGDIGGAMLPPPDGVWGMPPEMLKALPGYDPDVQKNRAQARAIMEKLGYGPDKRLTIKVSTRNIPISRDPAISDRPVEGDLYRRRARTDRHHQSGFPRSCARTSPSRSKTQTSGPDPDPILELLRLRFEPQLGRLLQPGGRQADRAAIDRGRSRRSASSWCGTSSASWRRTAPGRSSSTRAARPAGNPTSRG